MRGAPRQTGGFTLIEVAVAMALLALIAIAVFESLRFAQRAHAKVIERGGATWNVFAAQRLIRNVVESAYPLEPTQVQGTLTYGLAGDRDQVAIIAPTPLAASGAGLQRYELQSKRNARGRNDLVVRWHSDFAADATSAAMEETLVEDVATVEWSYMAAPLHESEPQEVTWLDDWRGQRTLPRLVRLKVSFAASDPRSWPDLVMAPMLTDDANCAFDTVAQRCRSGS
jgi:general secretion pathway protein J